MLFNTLTYLLFVPIVFVLYWMARNVRQQNLVLVVASMVFYGWWSPWFLLLMMATCMMNYALLVVMRKSSCRKLCLLFLLVVNFGILGLFKYFNFFAENLFLLLSAAGWHVDRFVLQLVLPVGISFYTFQLSSYAIDIYRNPSLRMAGPLQYIAFITFFPQLVAGPIERGDDMLPQLSRKRLFDYGQAREGMRLFLWGLMKKMLLADNCAGVVDYVFSHQNSASLLDLWLGALFFSFQIYGDFSGYSDMAVGSARLFGIRLHKNFDKPYFSRTMREFWHRWHITLMSWFKDYVYIPLGGNRRGALRKRLNVSAVFVLSGLWHGSNWTFLFWGVYHALFYVVPVRWLTFPIVMIGWVFFRSPDMSSAFQYIEGMFSPALWSGGATSCSRLPLVYVLLCVVIERMMRSREHPFAFSGQGLWKSQWVRMPIYLLCFLVTLLLGGEQVQFIYFQF